MLTSKFLSLFGSRNFFLRINVFFSFHAKLKYYNDILTLNTVILTHFMEVFYSQSELSYGEGIHNVSVCAFTSHRTEVPIKELSLCQMLT